MSDLIKKLLPAHLKTLKPYESARRLFSGEQQKLWLNANESPFANQYQLDSAHLNRYPDCQPQGVVQGYADYAGVAPKQVLATRGADEGIELLIRTFCSPEQSHILICPPTYGMYAISAESCNIGVKTVPLRSDFSLDIDAIKACKDQVNLIFICAPNNPTGTAVAGEQIASLLEHFADSALVVVDEAYFEFDPASNWAAQLSQYPNLVILRTLSKAFALAGLRCGFTLANPPVIQALLKVIAPYPIPEPVAQIAAQALSEQSITHMQQQLSELQQQKQRLIEALSQWPIELVGDDKANFVLFRTPHKQGLMDYLVSRDIVIRDQSKQLGLENCLRITLGNRPQQDRLLAAMADFFALQEQQA